MASFWPWYLALGAFAGLLAGLLGIGGGLVQVPLLVFLFSLQQFAPEHVLHLALGTAMASILFTAASSTWAHHGHGAVNWGIVRRMAPGIACGVAVAAIIAGQLQTRYLAIFFTAFVYVAATQLILNLRPKASRTLPGAGGMFTAGALIGGISSLVAAGGALLSVPWMAWCNVRLHEAIGTAAAIGFPIAIAGTVGYVANGWGEARLPEWSLGYVYLPALFWLVTASMAMAPLGAKLAHRTSTRNLRTLFALLLYVLATRMLVTLV
ncbi:MAG: sulfite exporter TauE/SafE family protein [Burkholderiales bacterium]|nr:sulfite exporter TauE/SafE family protein [Burkholderiales bacterium]